MALTFDFRLPIIALIACLAITANADINVHSEGASLTSKGPKEVALLPSAVIEDCTIVIEPFVITGPVQAIYLPKGVDVTVSLISDRSSPRLDYDLVRHPSTDTWSLTISLPTCGPNAVSNLALWCTKCTSSSDGATATFVRNTLFALVPVQSAAAAATEESGPTVVLVLQEGTILPDLESLVLSSQDSVLSSSIHEGLSFLPNHRRLLQIPTRTKDAAEEVEQGNDEDNEDNYPTTTTTTTPGLITSSPSVEQSPIGSTSNTPGGVIASSPTTSPVSTASGTPAPTTATSPAVSSCSLTVANEIQSYTMCYTLRIGTNFQVFYTLEADPSDSASSILSMAMQGASSGWIGVGFPSRAGRMTNAGSAILKACSTCPTGAAIDQYYMTGTNEQDVNPDTRLDMTEMKASASGGVLFGSWKMKLPGISATANRRRRNLLQLNFPASSFPLIYASGPISTTGDILEHRLSQSSSGNVDLLQGVAGGSGSGTGNSPDGSSGTGGDGSAPSEEENSENENIKRAHMWMATISWGFVIPIAILMARYFKPHTTLWFAIHRALASLGFLMAVATLVLGFEANGGWETDLPVHRNLGLTCTILAFVQVFSIINRLRPTKANKLRPCWFFVHSWLGRSAAVIGIANIYYGIIKVEELGTWAWASYTGVLGAIVLAAVVMEVVNWRMHKRTKNENEWNMMQAPSRPALSNLANT